MKLSIAMIVKNESKYLEQCLKALQPLRDAIESELVILDTGSEDNTVDIAKKYTDKVYFEPWNDNFAEMRNISISYTTGEWLFVLDADEILEDASEIIDFFKSNRCSEFNSASLFIKNIVNEGNEPGYSTVPLKRLFKRYNGFGFEGIVHEQPKFKEPIYKLKTKLIHYGYIHTDKELMKRKFERNVPLLKRQLEDQPDNHYCWFQLSQSYSAYREYKSALDAILKAYEIAKEKGILKISMYIYVQLAFTYYENQKYEKLEQICREAINTRDGYIDLYFLMAKAQMILQKNAEAIKSYNIYLDIVKKYDDSLYDRDMSVVTHFLGYEDIAYSDLAVLYDRKQEYENLLKAVEQIKDEKYIEKLFPHIIKAYVAQGKPEDIKDYFNKFVENGNENRIDKFFEALEGIRKDIEKENYIDIVKLFSDREKNYSILNRVRCELYEDSDNVRENLIKSVETLDFNSLSSFYGDIIYYLLKNGYRLKGVLSNVQEYKIDSYLSFICDKYEDLSTVICGYMREQDLKDNTPAALRINSVLLKFVLLLGEIEDEEHKVVFKQYISNGIEYVNQVYSSYVIENKAISEMRRQEDTFFLYMLIAEENKDKDTLKYVKSVKEALKVYPAMEKGISFIMEEIKTIEDKDSHFEMYKAKLKKNIEVMIEEGELGEAELFIQEYENIVLGDIDIISMKAVIAIAQQRFDEAEKLLKAGLNQKPDSFDLLYNLAYLYQFNAQNELAINYYKKALQYAKDKNDRDGVYEILHGLEVHQDKKEISKSVIPKTSIIILTYNNLQYNKLCIESIRKYTEKGTYEIIIVDNHSTDGTAEWLKEQEDLKLILNDDNLGFPKGCNQGIKAAEKDNDILLLNNDVIVTPNWLANLKKCLYSSDDIGAAGSVTNSCSNYQAISASYTNIDGMVNFAQSNNVSNESLWEERLRLVGYCMLVKNEVVKRIGLLDEIFTPGNFEDDDYSFRIRNAGYRLMLCKDSFIYHFGSVSFEKISNEYGELLIRNRKKFAEKWGFDPYYIVEIKKEITELINKADKEDVNILHIGCAGGGTLLDIKNTIPSAKLYGIEPVKEAVVNTSHFAYIEIGNFEKIKTFEKSYFDYIIITQPQENKEDIVYILGLIKNYVKNNGITYIVLSKDKTNWDRKFVKKLEDKIENCSLKIIRTNGQYILNAEKTTKGKSSCNLKLTLYRKKDLDKFYDEYVANSAILMNLIRRLDNKIYFEENLDKLRYLIMKDNIDVEEVKAVILKHGIDKVSLLNTIGIIYYQVSTVDKALALLTEAFKLDKENTDTIYNVAFILYQANENKMALDFLNGLNNIEKDTEILQLKQQIEEAI